MITSGGHSFRRAVMIKNPSASQVRENSRLLEISGLKTTFRTFAGIVKALQGIDLKMSKGETLGLVGETGCGKSVTALSILRLLPGPSGKIVGGEIIFDGSSLTDLSDEQIRKIRGNKISIVFQEPMTSLNPVLKVGEQIAEVVLLHQNLDHEALILKIQRMKEQKTWLELRGLGLLSKLLRLDEKIRDFEQGADNLMRPSASEKRQVAMSKAVSMLKQLGVPDPDRAVERYPHELSGGMRQRAMIAMALACKPSLLIADEPTTALDVTIQAQIIELLKELKSRMDTSILLITHHLGLVAEMCDKVAVMYAGRIVEYSETMNLFRSPYHPYTRGLLGSIPSTTKVKDRLEVIPGSVPDMIHPPNGCNFHPRCRYSSEVCSQSEPTLREVENQHFVSCFLYGEDHDEG